MIRHLVSLAAIVLVGAALGWAQSPAPATALPKNPKDLMLLASRVNGLSGLNKPWHLKANYQTFDADGKPKDQGIFEEWWASPERDKVSYTTKGFHQVRYQIGGAETMTGDSIPLPLAESMIRLFLTQPMPTAASIGAHKFTMRDRHDGPMNLKCIREAPTGKSTIVPVFCFGEDSPVLRAEALHGGFMVTFNKIARTNNHYFSDQFQVALLGKPVLNFHVTEFTPLEKVDDSNFGSPADSIAASPVQQIVAPDEIAKNRISGLDPRYPAIARAAHVSGAVVIVVNISPTGEVSDSHAVGGPPLLVRAALDAVNSWKYKPFLMNGRAASVWTEIVVSFTNR